MFKSNLNQCEKISRVTRTKLQFQDSYNRIGRWYDFLEGRWEEDAVTLGFAYARFGGMTAGAGDWTGNGKSSAGSGPFGWRIRKDLWARYIDQYAAVCQMETE
jgi:hypothetical protein